MSAGVYEWDEYKNRANAAKHGIRFALAIHIFKGSILNYVDDRDDCGELREISIGMIGSSAVIVVTHADRDGIIGIISARHANRAERSRYEQIFC